MQTSQPVSPSESPNPANDINPIVQTTEPSTIVPPITNHVEQTPGANPEPKKSSKKLLLLFALFGILFILAAVVIVVLASRPQNTTPTPTPTPTAEMTPSATPTATASVTPTTQASFPENCFTTCDDATFQQFVIFTMNSLESYQQDYEHYVEDGEYKATIYVEGDVSYTEKRSYYDANKILAKSYSDGVKNYIINIDPNTGKKTYEISDYTKRNYTNEFEVQNPDDTGVEVETKYLKEKLNGTDTRLFRVEYDPGVIGGFNTLERWWMNAEGRIIKSSSLAGVQTGDYTYVYSNFNKDFDLQAKYSSIKTEVEANL